jgi:hypothetical protein
MKAGEYKGRRKDKGKEERERKGESTMERRKVQREGRNYLDSEPDEGGSGLASEESELVVVMSLNTTW